MTGWSWETEVVVDDRCGLASVPEVGDRCMGQSASFERAPTTMRILLWPCEGQGGDADQWD